MQLTISASQQQLQFDYSQINLNQSAINIDPQLPMPARQDRIELSDDARRPHDAEHAVKQLQKARHDQNSSPLFDFIKEILEKVTGAQVNGLKNAPPVSDIPVPPAPAQVQGQSPSIAAEQSTLSFEASSFSLEGAITTGDGARFSFSLDLQMMHASASNSSFSLSNGQNGYNFNFTGSSAELTSTSFSFSLTTEVPTGTPRTAGGVGTFSLKDDLKEVQHTLKPYIDAFLKDSGMPSDNNSVKQLLHTIA